MSNNTNDPDSPSSALSKKARLAHWITGGTNRGPSTMSSFSRMARDRNDIKKATEAWALARERGLAEHQGQWGRSGVPGALDQAAAAGMDEGQTLGMRLGSLRCSNGDGRGNRRRDPWSVTRRMTYTGRTIPQGRGLREVTLAMATQQHAVTWTDDAPGQQQNGEGDDDHHEGDYARPAQQQREQTVDR
ncbi:hypothetical protein INS49_008610 [Diaporthe citri]|uniref:uncharacterized protein n=1 Tax=Diaporthe citri TaxID=83186 RepID=UPI001C803435|nr:uncharacterized protein INS49_008610 [Diaporthe citri]KAG6363510.1 hypothetical protein INS49_008610 [Diaporthe citri]